MDTIVVSAGIPVPVTNISAVRVDVEETVAVVEPSTVVLEARLVPVPLIAIAGVS